MAIHLKCPSKKFQNCKIHRIPFYIHADCEAEVSKYFETSVSADGEKTFKGSFRGFPLKGERVQVPNGYVGMVFYESVAPVTDQEDRNFRQSHKFQEITYWNWDKMPSKNDKIIQALDWIDIAEALHSPITD